MTRSLPSIEELRHARDVAHNCGRYQEALGLAFEIGRRVMDAPEAIEAAALMRMPAFVLVSPVAVAARLGQRLEGVDYEDLAFRLDLVSVVMGWRFGGEIRPGALHVAAPADHWPKRISAPCPVRLVTLSQARARAGLVEDPADTRAVAGDIQGPEFGAWVRDRVTTLCGAVVARSEDMTGARFVRVQPRAVDGRVPAPSWVPLDRIQPLAQVGDL